MTRMLSTLALLLCCYVAPIAAQQQPVSPLPQNAEPAKPEVPPKLSETHELRRQNVVLRANLLQAQQESLRLQLERENESIAASLNTLRSEIENAHKGWTIGPDGAVTKKVEAAKAEAEQKP